MSTKSLAKAEQFLPAVDPLKRFKEPRSPYRVPGMRSLPVTIKVAWNVSPQEDIPLHHQFPGLNGGGD